MDDVNASRPAEEQALPERVGFEIGGRFYPLATAEKLGDPAIIYEAIGLSWDAFQDGLGVPDPADGDDAADELVDDALILTGLVALAVAHGNPNWPRHKVVRYVIQLDAADLTMIGMDEAPSVGGVPPTTAPTPELEPEPPTTESGEQTRDATLERSPEPQA